LSKVIKNMQAFTSQNRQAKVISLRNIHGSSEESGEVNFPESQGAQPNRENILRDAEAEAERILESARTEAKRQEDEAAALKSSWAQEKELLQQEAYQEAYLQGLDEGRGKGMEEYRLHINEAVEVLSRAKDDYYAHIEKAERVILELGMETAEKIIGRALDENPSVFLDIIKRAIKEVKELPEVQIHVHPVHYPLLSENLEELESMFPVLRRLLIYPNEDLGNEECFIETGEGRVIVNVDTQLKEIKTKLVEILEGGE
jgi:flagellar assembly protein FliH